jgi:hypothetical protein
MNVELFSVHKSQVQKKRALWSKKDTVWSTCVSCYYWRSNLCPLKQQFVNNVFPADVSARFLPSLSEEIRKINSKRKPSKNQCLRKYFSGSNQFNITLNWFPPFKMQPANF